MLLFVGLGNPGRAICQKPPQHRLHGAGGDRSAPWLSARRAPASMASSAKGTIAGERVMLLAPQTYMNESGRSVGEAARFHKIGLDDDRRLS